MWSVRLTAKQREVLSALLRSQGHLGPALTGTLEALELSRWDELPDASLPWTEIESAVRAQGISEADAVWDACGALPEPAVIPLRARRAAGDAPARRAA